MSTPVCDGVTRCDRSAWVTVTFGTGGTQSYCRFHAFDRDLCLRWADKDIAHVVRHR